MRCFIAGGCGFIGSEMAKKLLQEEENEVVIYDNLSSGSLDLVKGIANDRRVSIIVGDVKDLKKLTYSMLYCDVVYHFASNADIAKAMADPTIDFYEGTLLTQNILEAMRVNGIKKIVYASGSGTYGCTGLFKAHEELPSFPISTYGASKVAGEALISAYCHMFDMRGTAYRFANVIGRNSTHGVIKDFIAKLKANPKELHILGSGDQFKGYMHVNDILDGINQTCFAHASNYDVMNLAPNSQITVNEIANMVVEAMGLENVKYTYGGGFGGWRGDVPQIVMDSEKARKLGWRPLYTSKEAVWKSIREMLGKE